MNHDHHCQNWQELRVVIHLLIRTKSDLAKTHLILHILIHPNAFQILQPIRTDLLISTELMNLTWLARRMSLLPSWSYLPPCKFSQPTYDVYILHPSFVLLPTPFKGWKNFATLNEYVLSRVTCFLWICLYWHFSGVFILTELSSIQKDLLVSIAPPQPFLSFSRWAYVTALCKCLIWCKSQRL